MDNIYAIIPVSKFKNAKTRLSPFLSEDEREKLLKVMLQDVTDTLKKHVDKIFIISRDEDGVVIIGLNLQARLAVLCLATDQH